MSEDSPKKFSFKTPLIVITLALVIGGCYYGYLYQSEVQRITPGSTTNFDGPKEPKKSLDEQIKDVETSKTIPAGFKMMVLNRLKTQKAAEAKGAKVKAGIDGAKGPAKTGEDAPTPTEAPAKK